MLQIWHFNTSKTPQSDNRFAMVGFTALFFAFLGSFFFLFFTHRRIRDYHRKDLFTMKTIFSEETVGSIRAGLHRVEKVYKGGLSFDLLVGKKFDKSGLTLLMNGDVIRWYQEPSQVVQDAILLSIVSVHWDLY